MLKLLLFMIVGLVLATTLHWVSSLAANSSDDLKENMRSVTPRNKMTVAQLPDLNISELPKRQQNAPTLLDQDIDYTNENTAANTAMTLKTKEVQLHYADAKQLADMLQHGNLGLLSTQGRVGIDSKNNRLWIRDGASQLKQIDAIIAQYDEPTPQIYIKAKIVNVDQKYMSSLGIAFNNSNGVNAEQGGIADLTIPIAKLGHDILLEATLDALEQHGHARLISNPELITLNRQPATIAAGEEVPYQQSTYSGGTSVSFKKAVLQLQVTPEIMPEQKVLLHLKINQDQVSSLTVNGVPAINTQEVTTQVYVKDKSTVVLGGIFEQSNTQQHGGIPGLSHLPLLGRLFRHLNATNEHKQLLIFVTPVIIHV